MNTLSREKLNFQKNKKKLTNYKISQLTGMPISNIDKIFSGTNKNPTLDTLQKIANVLECSIDDFIEYENTPISPIYIDNDTKYTLEYILKNKTIKEIFKHISFMNEKDIELILKLCKRLNKQNL